MLILTHAECDLELWLKPSSAIFQGFLLRVADFPDRQPARVIISGEPYGKSFWGLVLEREQWNQLMGNLSNNMKRWSSKDDINMAG